MKSHTLYRRWRFVLGAYMTTTKNHSLFCGCLQPTYCDKSTGTLTVLIQPSLINTRQIMQLIYSDILVTGRLVSWASGPLYSDVDISDTSSQDSAYLFLTGGSKAQTSLFIAWQRNTKYLYSLLKCLTEYSLTQLCEFTLHSSVRVPVFWPPCPSRSSTHGSAPLGSLREVATWLTDWLAKIGWK